VLNYIIKTALVVGLGSIGRRHIKVVKKLFPKVKIIVLRHKHCNEVDIHELNIYKCVTSIDEAIALTPQVAIVANPATKHIEVAKKLAINNIHLLIEKPISNSSKDAQELIDICHENNTLLITAYNLRFLPSLIEFKRLLQNEIIGNLYSIRLEVGQYLPSWRPEIDYTKSVSAKKSLGGGVLLELSHEIDYLMWIFGSVNWVKSDVSKLSNLDVDVEDSASIILGLDGNNGTKLVASLNMDFIRHDSTRRCVVIGEKGTLSWDGISGKVSHFSQSNNNWEVLYSLSVDSDFSYIEEIKSFFSSVENNSLPNTYEDSGMLVVKVIEAIKTSDTTGSIVYV
jgi:predicted dehydrogenase